MGRGSVEPSAGPAFPKTFFNASDYGWSTTNTAAQNETAFAAAIAAVRASTLVRALYLGVGTYQKTTGLNLKSGAVSTDKGGIELFGVNRNSTTVVVNDDTAELLQVGGYNNYVHDLCLKHPVDAPTATTGDGVVSYKCAYSTFKRLLILNTGHAFAIAQQGVADPGGTSNASANWFFSNTVEDFNVNRYSKNGLFLNSYSGGSTGSTWTNIYLQNLKTDGTQATASGAAAIDILNCDFTGYQVNVEDLTGNRAILANAQSNVIIAGFHLERVHKASGEYVRAYGGAQIDIRGFSLAFSDVGLSGSGLMSLFTVGLGGQITCTSYELNNNLRTSTAGTFSVAEASDTNAANVLDIGYPLVYSSPAFTATTYTSITNSSLKRIGDVLYAVTTNTAARIGKRNWSGTLALTTFTQTVIPFTNTPSISAPAYVTTTATDGTTETNGFRVLTAGYYDLAIDARFTGGTSNNHTVGVNVNGTANPARRVTSQQGGSLTMQAIALGVKCNVGDIIGGSVYTEASSVNLFDDGSHGVELTVKFVGV